MGGGVVNEPHPRSQRFSGTWLESEELCSQSGASNVATAITLAGFNPSFDATSRKESGQSVVEVLEGL